jgi:hypothetical protein
LYPINQEHELFWLHVTLFSQIPIPRISPTLSMTIITISRLFLYPIKSCRGIPVDSAEITPLGFKNDRRYMLVETKPSKADVKDDLNSEKWVPMTLREYPRVDPCASLIADGFNLDHNPR